MSEIDRLLGDLRHPGVPVELGVTAGCILAAWVICRLLSRERRAESVWFGRRVVDGLAFPLMALALVYGATVLLARSQNVGLLRLVVAVLVALAGIRFVARVLARVFPASRMARAGERVFSWLAWLGAVAWILGLMPVIERELDGVRFSFGKNRLSLLDIGVGLLSSLAVMVAALWISAAIEQRVLSQAVDDRSLRKVASNTIRALLLSIGLLVALSSVGVDLTALSVVGGALSVGLGFGLQKLASNYVSGFVILFERSVRIGDWVKVDNFEGEVVDIKTRYTLLRGASGRESIVPNEKFIVERIENQSLGGRGFPVAIEATVHVDNDPDVVRRALQEAAAESALVAKEPPPGTRLSAMGVNTLTFALAFSTHDEAPGQVEARSDVNLRVLAALRAAGVKPAP